MQCLDSHAGTCCGRPQRLPRSYRWSSSVAAACSLRPPHGSAGNEQTALDAAEAAAVSADGPLMVCIRDAEGGDVSILHGTEEVVVRDRRLVAKIVHAKSGAKKA